jgi:hypothetical protein
MHETVYTRRSMRVYHQHSEDGFWSRTILLERAGRALQIYHALAVRGGWLFTDLLDNGSEYQSSQARNSLIIPKGSYNYIIKWSKSKHPPTPTLANTTETTISKLIAISDRTIITRHHLPVSLLSARRHHIGMLLSRQRRPQHRHRGDIVVFNAVNDVS